MFKNIQYILCVFIYVNMDEIHIKKKKHKANVSINDARKIHLTLLF